MSNESFFDKVKDFVKGHPEQADQGLDKAEEILNERTGGQYSEKVVQGDDAVRQQLGIPEDEGTIPVPDPTPGPTPTPEPVPTPEPSPEPGPAPGDPPAGPGTPPVPSPDPVPTSPPETVPEAAPDTSGPEPGPRT
ncbi:MAG: antitoxin [Lapillicoccus sp.]